LLLTIDLRDLAKEEVADVPADPAAFGNAWLRDQRSPARQVPSLPTRMRGGAGIIARRRFEFDRRLWLPLRLLCRSALVNSV